MPSETDIANLALTELGGAGDQGSGSGLISSINGSDRVSVACKLQFPRVRRTVIADLADSGTPFKEALKYAVLGAEVTPSIETGGWGHAFSVPGDNLKVCKQIPQDFRTTQTSITDVPKEYRFEILWQDTTKILLTNNLTSSDGLSAFIQYAFDQKNPGTFSEVMINCIATLLASRLAPTQGKDGDVAAELLAKYKLVRVPEAMAYNQSQDNRTVRDIGDYKGGRSDAISTIHRGVAPYQQGRGTIC